MKKNDIFLHTYYINKKTQRPFNGGRGSSKGERVSNYHLNFVFRFYG